MVGRISNSCFKIRRCSETGGIGTNAILSRSSLIAGYGFRPNRSSMICCPFHETPLKKEIYEQIRYYATTSVARRIEHIVQAIKLACASEPPEIQTDRIHVRNGTYFVDGHFTPEKEYCMNRLPIAYVPEAPAPTRWLQFLNELLYEEDIPALQEYIGYCLLPVTKAQKMLLMVGKGGEGKSRIGLILRELFGSSMYTGSLQKV